jgi:hypothetical protein
MKPARVFSAVCALLAAAMVAPGCENCHTEEYEARFGLRAEERGLPCEKICAEAVGWDQVFESCLLGDPNADPQEVICHYSLNVCPSQSL